MPVRCSPRITKRRHFSSFSNWGLGMISDDSTGKANDKKQIRVYMKHFPCGTSLKCLNHCVQIYQSKIFTMYDYRDEANVFLYKSLKPPEYPAFLFYVGILLSGSKEF